MSNTEQTRFGFLLNSVYRSPVVLIHEAVSVDADEKDAWDWVLNAVIVINFFIIYAVVAFAALVVADNILVQVGITEISQQTSDIAGNLLLVPIGILLYMNLRFLMLGVSSAYQMSREG